MTEESESEPVTADRPSLLTEMRTSEDWWAIWCAGFILIISLLAVWNARPADLQERVAAGEKVEIKNPMSAWLSKPGSWTNDPVASFFKVSADGETTSRVPGMLGAFLLIGAVFFVAMAVSGQRAVAFLIAFVGVFFLAVVSYVMAEQKMASDLNLEYALWALLMGMVISNTVGTPALLQPAVRTEFYIKTGLVLLGAEVLLSRLLVLGLPGILVSWIVTPVVLITTYIFGQKILKMESRSLNMVISADMSVCGVSAAIATAAACKAKKEELSLAVGLSLTFTVIMMVVMPWIVEAVGMDEILAGAWFGGTIDSTGAVAAAGAMVGDRALEVAATVKMIQNVLIGVTAFFVALYWVTYVERDPNQPKPGWGEIWIRFPKFVLGFVLVSLLFSILHAQAAGGAAVVDSVINGSTKVIRGWLFCLAFVSIGLETNFRQLAPFLRGGKPLTLYVCGQSLNLILSLLMSWLMFRVIFRETIERLLP